MEFVAVALLVALGTLSQGQPIGPQAHPLCPPLPPRDCQDVHAGGARADGVYLVSPGGGGAPPVPVYCDMSTEGHVWTVFQRRFNGSVSFFRGWNDYRAGFGRADGEYWLGTTSTDQYRPVWTRKPHRNPWESIETSTDQYGPVQTSRDYRAGFGRADGLQTLALLTQQARYELRVELEDFENNSASATYGSFALSPTAVSPEEDGYALHVAGFVDGGAGDSLSYHNGQKFSTFDRDQDLFAQNCAALSSGAWWFRSCHFSNLNGFYLAGPHLSYANGINWAQWKGFYYSLKRSEMKIRRL